MVSVALHMSGAFMSGQPGHPAVRGMAPPPHVATPTEVTLRVSGGKPLRIVGVIMAEANSWSPSVPAWHEVTLYRTQGQECAASIRMLKKAMGETDIHHAELFASIEEGLNWLEEFDPTADLVPDFDASDRRVSTAEIALLSAALRQHADAVTRQWRGLLGEVLYRFSQPG